MANIRSTFGEPVGGPVNSQILGSCASAQASAIAYGPTLLPNGDFKLSVGGTAGPFWATDYTVNGAGGPGQMGISTGPDGSPAWYVDISTNLTARIFYWTNVYLENGATYEATMSLRWSGFAAQMNVAIRIDGGAPVVGLLGNQAAWVIARNSFVFTGITGYHTIAVTSNSTTANGNDGAFDNVALRKVFPAQVETRTAVAGLAGDRYIIDQVVESTNCNDDRREMLLAEISNGILTQIQLQTHGTIIGAAAAVTQTIGALLPTGKVFVELGFRVLAGTANMIDSDGTVVNGLPVGFSAKWTAPATGKLTPIRSITAIANSRVQISFSVR